MPSNPLVSIVVITYNSSKYILETLESAKSQSYQNIELIITDDCSSDDTVKICRKWLSINSDRFVRTELLEAPKNTGISPNCNRGYSAAQGEWIKGIAGDDVLLNNCISDNVEHVLANPEIDIQFSRIDYICDDLQTINRFKSFFREDFYTLNAREQLEQTIRRGYCVPAPACFIRKTLHDKYSFDERIKLVEDAPYWIKLTSKGYKLYLLPEITVKYRVQGQNISISNKSNKYLNMDYRRVYIYYHFPILLKINICEAMYSLLSFCCKNIKWYIKGRFFTNKI